MWLLIEVDDIEDVGNNEHNRFLGRWKSMEKLSESGEVPLKSRIVFEGIKVHPATTEE